MTVLDVPSLFLCEDYYQAKYLTYNPNGRFLLS